MTTPFSTAGCHAGQRKKYTHIYIHSLKRSVRTETTLRHGIIDEGRLSACQMATNPQTN